MLQLEALLQKHSISWDTWLYGFTLGTIIFVGFLIYDYRKRAAFLHRVEQYIADGHTLHDSLLVSTSSSYEQEVIVEAFSLLREQYMNEVHDQQAKEQQ